MKGHTNIYIYIIKKVMRHMETRPECGDGQRKGSGNRWNWAMGTERGCSWGDRSPMQCADDALLVFFFFNLFFIVILLVFFLKILFIYMRERGREGEREGEKPRYSREISVGGLPIRSQPDQTAKQACRLTGKEPTTF